MCKKTPTCQDIKRGLIRKIFLIDIIQIIRLLSFIVFLLDVLIITLSEEIGTISPVWSLSLRGLSPNDDQELHGNIDRSAPAYGELEERLELLESSMTPVSPHMEERMELLESLLNREQEQEQEHARHNKRSAEQVGTSWLSKCKMISECWVLMDEIINASCLNDL